MLPRRVRQERRSVRRSSVTRGAGARRRLPQPPRCAFRGGADRVRRAARRRRVARRGYVSPDPRFGVPARVSRSACGFTWLFMLALLSGAPAAWRRPQAPAALDCGASGVAPRSAGWTVPAPGAARAQATTGAPRRRAAAAQRCRAARRQVLAGGERHGRIPCQSAALHASAQRCDLRRFGRRPPLYQVWRRQQRTARTSWCARRWHRRGR